MIQFEENLHESCSLAQLKAKIPTSLILMSILMPFKECVNAWDISATYKTYFTSSKKLTCKQGLTSLLLIHVYQPQITTTCKAPAYIYIYATLFLVAMCVNLVMTASAYVDPALWQRDYILVIMKLFKKLCIHGEEVGSSVINKKKR